VGIGVYLVQGNDDSGQSRVKGGSVSVGQLTRSRGRPHRPP
jgi:hypothetical protein